MDGVEECYKNHFNFQFKCHCLRDVKVVSGADTNKTVGNVEHARRGKVASDR